ncbi:MAG: homoserine dehydrogenase [Candidatus Bipolaricaulota bacterium]|nr:homoserine dehydrogenase [Candidatus Bipolaricaulota bacterium]
MTARTVRIAISGLGNLGTRFIKLISDKQAKLRERYNLDLQIVAAVDSRGAVQDPHGLDLDLILKAKASTGTVANYPQLGTVGMNSLDLVHQVEADVWCEATPVNLARGAEPATSCIRTALARGMHVVTPDKGPIILFYQELTQLASECGVYLRFGGTVAGGLPALYIGSRDLRGATIDRIEAVPNLVTGFILDLIGDGTSWDEAISLAKREGVLEADPTWDLDGWDAAAKLVILANAVLSYPARLEDVKRSGISDLSDQTIRSEFRSGRRMRLLATALRSDSGYSLSVTPQVLPEDHPLGRLGPKEMGITYYTDIYGTITAIIKEETPLPSAATMLRDIFDIALGTTS